MRKFFKIGWIALYIIICIVYLLSCLTPFINPQYFSYISLLAIAFPYIFLAVFICTFTFLFINRRTTVFLFLFVLAAGFKNLSNTIAVNTANWQIKKDSTALRIMTWNVESFVNDFVQTRPEAKPRIGILKAIQLYNPDVLCLQEYRDTQHGMALYASVKKELDSLGYKYFYISNDSIITQYHPATVIQGVAIYSRLPLIDSNRINLINVTRNENLIYTDVVFDKKRVRLFTGHLLSFGLYVDTTNNHEDIYKTTYRRKRSVEYKLRETEVIHAQEVLHIRKIIAASPYPVIYCGDINATPASYTYNTLRGGLQDAFLQKGCGFGTTFYKLGQTLRIDVCLPDKQFKVVQCTVPQLYLSDHFPVVTDLIWK